MSMNGNSRAQNFSSDSYYGMERKGKKTPNRIRVYLVELDDNDD